MSFLQGASIKQIEIMKQELGEGPGDMEECLRNLRNFLAASPYLPDSDVLETRLLESFVTGCRMNMERARKKLENFCLARARYPDLFEYRSLNESPLNIVSKFMDIATLPRLTDEGYRVTIFRIKDNYPECSSDITDAVRAILLVSDVRMRDEHLIAGDVFIYESSNIRASLAARVAAGANAVRKSIQLAQGAYPQRLKRIHVVGAPPMLASSLAFMRSCVNEKIRKRYYIHQKVEELLDHIPARVLPAEWGGEEESIDAIADKWRVRIDENRDWLDRLNEECQRAPAPVTDTDIYGTAGAFRKLDID